MSPLRGVFAVRVDGLGEPSRPAIANLGTRPTVAGDTRYLLEVHLFDFAADIYGAHLQVEFCRKIRDEQRFDSFEHLRQQILRDVRTAREFFGLAAAGDTSS